MKLRQFGLLTVLGFSWMSFSARAEGGAVIIPEPAQFCMQTYNAYGPLYAPATRERMSWIGALLIGMPRCSVIQLQEVWNNSNIDQIENSFKHQYSVSSPNRGQRIGVMSIFDSDIKSTETVTFKVNSEGGLLDKIRKALDVKKAFHVVRTELFAMNEEFYFINVHLHPNSQAVRLTQILDMLNWRLQHQDLKVLMSGDFNADESSFDREFMMATMGLHDTFQESLGGRYPDSLCTYCANNPHSWRLDNHVLDYIFVSNIGGADTHLKVQRGEINMRGPLREPLSDHYGVRVYFTLESGQKLLLQDQQGAQRNAMMAMLDHAVSVFSAQKAPEFAPYGQKAKALKQQLLDKQGDFNAYLEKFN
ncbi:MAG: endonuclease/exonuclease/phosphatase family protein [Bdellovibrio sp.]